MTPALPRSTPRLSPIRRPRSWFVRLFDWLMKKRLGKSLTASHVIYARLPSLLWRTLPFYHLLDRGLSLAPALRHLIEVKVSLLNGCSFCTDLHLAEAARAGVSREQRDALLIDSLQAFDPATRAALVYVTLISQHAMTDEAFAQLRAHFGERQIIELTWLQAFVTYLNRMAVPLGIGSDGFCALPGARS